MKVYHRTASENAAAILQGGFRDHSDTYMTSSEHTGVWAANIPLDENEGAGGSAVLEVDIDESAIAHYEWVQWVQEIGYREWLVPARILNAHAQIRLLTELEVDAIAEARWRQGPP